MHLTSKVKSGVVGLRSRDALAEIWRLVGGMQDRGVQVLMVQVQGDHIHLAVIPSGRQALHNATRYFFGLLARFLNKLTGRQGPVFTDRFASRIAKAANDIWNVFGYIARNPRDARMSVCVTSWDRGFAVNAKAIVAHPFLQRIFGTDVRRFSDLLWRMRFERLPYAPLRSERQLRLALT